MSNATDPMPSAATDHPRFAQDRVHVIHHSADFDGLFCREIARGSFNDPVLIGWDYGQAVPDIPKDTLLVMLDIAVEQLMDHPNLLWIDHHKSATEKYPASIPGHRVDGVAACRLAWQFFRIGFDNHRAPGLHRYRDRTVIEPLAVRLAGEYDVWDKRDPDADLFQFGLRSEPLTPQLWKSLLSYNGAHVVERLLCQGRFLQHARTEDNAAVIASNGFDTKFHGLTFLACNASRYNSSLFAAGIKDHHDALLGFCLRSNGRWTVSLYHRPGREDLDLSKIASAHGGGGHRGACGFNCLSLPFPIPPHV